MNFTPESLALLMGGANMLAASRGGSTDLTKGGLGYALQQGMQGAVQGAQMGQGFEDKAQKKAALESYANTLDPEAKKKFGPLLASGAVSPVDLAKMTGAGKVGAFKDMNEYLKAIQTTRKAAQTSLAPSNESLRKYAQVTDLVRKKGGFENMTGADDTVNMKAFASMILPGEAVMSDDINIIAQQDGLPGWFKSYAAQLKGNGQLDPTQRADMYRTMTTLAERAYKENEGFRKQFTIDKDLGNFPDGSIFTESIGFNPYEFEDIVSPAPVADKPTGEVKVLNNKKYVKTAEGWEEI